LFRGPGIEHRPAARKLRENDARSEARYGASNAPPPAHAIVTCQIQFSSRSRSPN
jgi:hypothetical protein